MIQFEITHVDSVLDFLYEMFTSYGNKFDPADPISSWEHSGLPVYNESDAAYLDSVMTECFIFCVLNGLNIYTLATIVDCDIKKMNMAA